MVEAPRDVPAAEPERDRSSPAAIRPPSDYVSSTNSQRGVVFLVAIHVLDIRTRARPHRAVVVRRA